MRKGPEDPRMGMSGRVGPFSQHILPWRSKPIKALFFQEVTGFCQLIDFVTPPMSLSVAAAFDDQTPGKEKNDPNHNAIRK